MYIVQVNFVSKPDFTDQFREALLQQAENSLELEDGCYIFDVCVDPENPNSFLLYEMYHSEKSFKKHLNSTHFLSFNETTQKWVESKEVQIWNRIS